VVRNGDTSEEAIAEDDQAGVVEEEGEEHDTEVDILKVVGLNSVDLALVDGGGTEFEDGVSDTTEDELER